MWSRNRESRSTSEFWTIQSDEAIGIRIAPRFRISPSSVSEKTFWKLFQISATQSTVAVTVPIVWPRIAPLTPPPMARMTMIAVRLKAGRAASIRAKVNPRPSNQMTISASLKIAHTPPVMAANRTTGPWLESCRRNEAICVWKMATSAVIVPASNNVQASPTPSV